MTQHSEVAYAQACLRGLLLNLHGDTVRKHYITFGTFYRTILTCSLSFSENCSFKTMLLKILKITKGKKTHTKLKEK